MALTILTILLGYYHSIKSTFISFGIMYVSIYIALEVVDLLSIDFRSPQDGFGTTHGIIQHHLISIVFNSLLRRIMKGFGAFLNSSTCLVVDMCKISPPTLAKALI